MPEGGDDVVCGHVLAVVEGQALAQLEHPLLRHRRRARSSRRGRRRCCPWRRLRSGCSTSRPRTAPGSRCRDSCRARARRWWPRARGRTVPEPPRFGAWASTRSASALAAPIPRPIAAALSMKLRRLSRPVRASWVRRSSSDIILSLRSIPSGRRPPADDTIEPLPPGALAATRGHGGQPSTPLRLGAGFQIGACSARSGFDPAPRRRAACRDSLRSPRPVHLLHRTSLLEPAPVMAISN